MSLPLNSRQLIEPESNRLLSFEGLWLWLHTLELALCFSGFLKFFKGISRARSALLFTLFAEVYQSVESEFKLIEVGRAFNFNVSF